MQFHEQTPEAVLSELNSNAQTGLTSAEAEARRQQHGPNRLREKKKKTNLQRFAEQFKDVMILILIAAAIISFVVACTGHDPKEFF